MTFNKDLLKAPILPNKGAAGVKLGAIPATVQKLWGEPFRIEQIKPDLIHWDYQHVRFDFKAGKLDQIWLKPGYAGKTRAGIGLGSTRQEVESVFGPLDWDGTWLINIPPFGIGFDFSPDLGRGPRVTDIFVFRE